MSYYPYHAPSVYAPAYPAVYPGSYASSVIAADAAAAASVRAAAVDAAVARSYVPLSPRAYSPYATHTDVALANAESARVANDIALSASVRRARLGAYSPYY